MSTAALRHAKASDNRFEHDVVAGLSASQKYIPCQWFYDYLGSELFEEITQLPEYYLTRAETALLQAHAMSIAAHIGSGASVVEFGSGSSRKTPLLLGAMADLQYYFPVDIAADFLAASVRGLQAQMPGLKCRPIVADLTDAAALRSLSHALPLRGPRVGAYLGSSIGNFTPAQAQALLGQFGDVLGPASWLVIGVDSTRDPNLLIPAYDDARGVTARFDLNLLSRINRELGGNFDLECFRHEAPFYPDRDRIEMHLVSLAKQRVRVAGHSFVFGQGERVHTENCHKFTVAQFSAMARGEGWKVAGRWGESLEGFGVFLLGR
ncbi:MAG: L-histidine N(alpha)-methyltransferase [Burkholderiales bacterium]